MITQISCYELHSFETMNTLGYATKLKDFSKIDFKDTEIFNEDKND